MAIGLDKCLDHSSNNLAKSDIKKSIECYMDTLYKITHTNKSKATVITLLGLIYRCTIVFDLAKNRFYRLIYDKLQEIDIFDTSNEKRLYNIVHQMLSQDDNISRISAFLKRILQSSMHESNSSKSLACLIIVQNIIRNNKKLKILFKPGLDDTFDAGKRAPEFSNVGSRLFRRKVVIYGRGTCSIHLMILQLRPIRERLMGKFAKLSFSIFRYVQFERQNN